LNRMSSVASHESEMALAKSMGSWHDMAKFMGLQHDMTLFVLEFGSSFWGALWDTYWSS
jgi:hypothetical protein